MDRRLARISLALGALLAVGCGSVEQSAACATWTRCIDARDEASGLSTDNARFEVDGGCWEGAEGAKLCTSACESGIAWLRDAYSDLPQECL